MNFSYRETVQTNTETPAAAERNERTEAKRGPLTADTRFVRRRRPASAAARASLPPRRAMVLAALAIGVSGTLGCGSSPPGETAKDASPTEDATQFADTGHIGGSGNGDASHPGDPNDASIAVDASDATVALDANDSGMTIDASDAARAVDAGDAGDAGGATDATMASDASDAGVGLDSGDAAMQSDASDGGAGTDSGGCVPASCASGACAPDGGCLPACSTSNPCSGALQCCSGQCVNPARDPNNCGTCGNACSGLQFCTGTACEATIVSNICKNPKALVVQDGLGADDIAADVLGAGLAACSPKVSVRYANQDSGVLDPTTHAPLSGPGETSATVGGSYGQELVGYMNQANEPVVPTADSTTIAYVLRSTGATIVRIPIASVTETHDYFLIALATDPASGSLVVSTYGLLSGGTAASSWYFSNVMMASLSTFTSRWYIYEWTAAGSDGGASTGAGPSSADTFRLVDSGL